MKLFTRSDEEREYPTTLPRSEKLFNWLTYGGISFLGVFVGTIPFTHAFKYGHAAQWWNKSAQWLKNKGLSESASEQILNTGFLGMLGNFAIIPIKFLENQKTHI